MIGCQVTIAGLQKKTLNNNVKLGLSRDKLRLIFHFELFLLFEDELKTTVPGSLIIKLQEV